MRNLKEMETRELEIKKRELIIAKKPEEYPMKLTFNIVDQGGAFVMDLADPHLGFVNIHKIKSGIYSRANSVVPLTAAVMVLVSLGFLI